MNQVTSETTTAKATKATTKETTAMAKAARPQMAGNKTWTFDIKHDQEIPTVQRTGRRLPFDFDSMKLGSMFFVPKEFWLEFLGLTEAQASDAARNKEAIRRSFYNWRDKEPGKRGKFALAFSDQVDPRKGYTGVNVYMANAPKKAA